MTGNLDSIVGEIGSFGISMSEMRAAARRQMVGSIVVASLVVAVVTMVGFSSHPYSPTRYASVPVSVQQPMFVAPPDHVASIESKVEAP